MGGCLCLILCLCLIMAEVSTAVFTVTFTAVYTVVFTVTFTEPAKRLLRPGPRAACLCGLSVSLLKGRFLSRFQGRFSAHPNAVVLHTFGTGFFLPICGRERELGTLPGACKACWVRSSTALAGSGFQGTLFSVVKESISRGEMNSPRPLLRVLLCKTRIVNRAQRVLTYYSPPWQKYASQVFKGKTLEALSLSWSRLPTRSGEFMLA